jgi:prolyl 4-hydroxylase
MVKLTVRSHWLLILVVLLSLQNQRVSAENPSLDEQRREQQQEEVDNSYKCFDNLSWAIHSKKLSDGMHRQERYEAFLDGCRNAAGVNWYAMCDAEENLRMQMNNYQPRSVQNYTATGFYKTRAPEAVFHLIQEFWEENKNKSTVEWHKPTTYHNNWEIPPTIIRVDDRKLVGGGKVLQAAISNAARDVMEEWTGQRLASTSVYGIRIYHNQSILSPHVDRLPLVSSAIINVAQSTDEPWPLEVYDHDGVAHNITMEPGDMVMYESHSVIHGRPHPLQGEFYANVFVHFEPMGPLDDSQVEINKSGLPPYVLEGSSWEPEWRDANPKGWSLLSKPKTLVEKGDMSTLQYVAKMRPSILHEADAMGWQPIHEAARQGHLDILQYLVDNGADINAVSKVRRGYAPLSIAQNHLGDDHPVTKLLVSLGAVPLDGQTRKSEVHTPASSRSEL